MDKLSVKAKWLAMHEGAVHNGEDETNMKGFENFE